MPLVSNIVNELASLSAGHCARWDGLKALPWDGPARLAVLDGGSPLGQVEQTDLAFPPLAALKFSG